MQQWEYMHLIANGDQVSAPGGGPMSGPLNGLVSYGIDDALIKLGEDSWELVSVVPLLVPQTSISRMGENTPRSSLYFKRPKS